MDSVEKRALIAMVLALAILMGYQFLMPGPVTKEPQKKEVAPAPKESALPAPTPPVVEGDAAPARDVRVETDLYIATFTSRGGTVKSLALKTHKDAGGNNVSLLPSLGAYAPLAVTLGPDAPGLSNANFRISGSDLHLSGSATGTIIFEYASPQGSIKRTCTFYGDQYRFDVADEVSGIPEYWVVLGSHFGIHDSADTTAPHIGPVVLRNTDRIELNAKKLEVSKTYSGGLRWIAQEDKYFCAALIPPSQDSEASAWQKGDAVTVALKGRPGTNTLLVYAGPKEYRRIEALGVGLEHIIDFGYFSLLARPLFWILKFFYSFVGNYGWAIVLLTIIVRIPFIPLINKGQKSMKRLQELQPRMNEIKEKYKKDPQRMQKEMMELYKKYKVNPVSGCMPILLQLPVFFALYKVLVIAIELRGAPFIWWVKDLSAPDSLFGHIPAWMPLLGGFAVGPLPILMGLSMLVQQKLTPTSVDPAQNRIMMFMNVAFIFIFLNVASGLVLYWFVNNIFSIAQQLYTNRRMSLQKS